MSAAVRLLAVLVGAAILGVVVLDTRIPVLALFLIACAVGFIVCYIAVNP